MIKTPVVLSPKPKIKTFDDKKSPWWKGAIVYQIYPLSFYDSNNDGLGDIQGIIAKLPYILSLNVDAIWLSPFFTTPLKDFGYDVSDYKNVDSRFGSLSDFDELVRLAHENGLKVIIDQVYAHTSDKHPWFQESRLDRENPKNDWFIWADAKADGSAPNNWLSIFGGQAWRWEARRAQYYMHTFVPEQPHLNFHCPAVRAALLDVLRFWLQRKVDGFRLDTVNFYYHDAKLRNNPPLSEGLGLGLLASNGFNPYAFQRHLYDKNRPEMLSFLEDMREIMDEYGDITTIGEVGDDQIGLEIISKYTCTSKEHRPRLHTCYGFDFLQHKFSVEHFKHTLEKFIALAQGKSWICWSFSNHDVMRSLSRWGALVFDDLQKNEETKLAFKQGEFSKLILALLASIQGMICIYQGEELGLAEAEVAPQDMQDPFGIYFYPEYKGRDGCRTPFPWNSKQQHVGFSKAKKTWLPSYLPHAKHAGDAQEKNENSVLHFTRQFLAWRKNRACLKTGDMQVLRAAAKVLVLRRKLHEEKIDCIFNFSSETTVYRHAEHTQELLFEQGLESRQAQDFTLLGFGFIFLA